MRLGRRGSTHTDRKQPDVAYLSSQAKQTARGASAVLSRCCQQHSRSRSGVSKRQPNKRICHVIISQMVTGENGDGDNGTEAVHVNITELSTSSGQVERLLNLIPGMGRRASSASAESSTKRVERKKKIDMANAMSTDSSMSVPPPPDLVAAVREQKSGGGKLEALMDPAIVAKIKSGKWRATSADDAAVDEPAEFLGRCRPDARKRPLPGCHEQHKYECLVFKGGGAKGAIYPGAIRALEEAGVMPHIKRFAGASAGSLVAALLAVGLNSEQLFVELATTDLKPLVLDSSSSLAQTTDLISKWGAHPGHGLFRHLGILFYKYTGNADITFRELYELYGVELAVAVTNISRASVELLHAKTAPDYPIRKAVRASMSLPVALLPCKDKNIHGVISDDVSKLTRAEKEAARRASAAGSRRRRSSLGGLRRRSSAKQAEPGEVGSSAAAPMEYYVDGGVLNNYPIDSFDGWWLSMEKEDEFFTRVVGEGGHKNYVERFGSYDEAIGARQVNPGTMGFRLASAYEPDAMHSRLGNDALELKVRGSTSARLPDTILANKYAPHRYDLTNEAKARLQLEKALRECMTWIKKLRVGARKAASGGGQATLPRRRVSTLMEHFEQTPPPTEVFTVLDLTEGSLDELIEALRAHHDRRKHVLSGSKNGAAKREVKRVPTKAELQMVLEEDAEAAEAIRRIYERNDLTETGKIDAIQKIVLESVEEGVPSLLQACDELTELLEQKAEDVMKRLCGMEPKEISSLAGFINRMVEAIQMTNDERVQTKENYSRTCMLNTEYVGTMDFKLEEGDHYFMWNKGYLTANAWLDKRSTKAKDKKKKVAKLIAKELKDQAKEMKAEEEKTKTADGAAISSLLSSSMNRVTGRATGPASPPAASLGGAAGSAAGGAAAAFKTAALKAKINKVIQSTTLRDQEKLDLIQRHLAQI